MTRWRTAALLLIALSAPTPAASPEPYASVQVVVREQIIVRLPAGRGAVAAAKPVTWKEGRGPKCLSAHSIVGASMASQNSVDLIMRDHSRVRARLDKACPALDFYYGFYISPNADGRICADRDMVRSRVGGECGIDGFRSLKAVVKP